jgi:hypothetical protein
VALAALGQSVTAQVGYPPNHSPFHDLEYSQEVTILGGTFHAHRDPADVAPQSGTISGVHYEWRPSGPVELIGEFAHISSDRRIINPFKAGTAREVGTTSRPLYALDAGIGMSLPGGKSWHRLVPELQAGMGFISDLKVQPDTGGFRFGTRFAFNMGAGIKYVPAGHWQVRADLLDRFYTIAYPETFYTAPTGGTAVVGAAQARSFWTNNPALTLGLSYLF